MTKKHKALTFFALILSGSILIEVISNFIIDRSSFQDFQKFQTFQNDQKFQKHQKDQNDQSFRNIKSLFHPFVEKTFDTSPSPFYTRYFQPPSPEKSRKHQITFQGFYESSSEAQKAFLLVDDDFRSVRVGETIVAGFILLSLNSDGIEIGTSEADKQCIGFQKTAVIETSQ